VQLLISFQDRSHHQLHLGTPSIPVRMVAIEGRDYHYPLSKLMSTEMIC
jgi:hypothetical protein